MAQRSGGQKTGPHRLPLYSPTQKKQLSGCLRRWAWNRLMKLLEPSTPNAEKGSERHEELELFHKLGKPPTSLEAKAAMKYAPAPRMGAAEVAVRYDVDGTCWFGFVDLAYCWRLESGPWTAPEQQHRNHRSFGKPPGKPGPLGATDIVVIHDWKFTSSFDYALTCESLYDDFAANMYALEAFDGGAERVFCRWVYTEFGNASPREVWAEMNEANARAILQDGAAQAAYANQLRAEYARLQTDAERDAFIRALPTDTDSCFAFNKECPRFELCQPQRESRRITIRSQEEMDNFEQEIAEQFAPETPAAKPALPPLPGKPALPAKPALPGKPALPALPGKPGLPPLPGKPALPAKPAAATYDVVKAAAGENPWGTTGTPVGTAEGGFVNPAEKPFPLAASPEEAVANGNVHTVESKPVEQGDDLESIQDLNELRKIADAIGATYLPKARKPGVIAAIRARRAELALSGEMGGVNTNDQGENGEGSESEDEQFERERAQAGVEAARIRAELERELDEDPEAHVTPVTIISQTDVQEVDMGTIGELPSIDDVAKAAESWSKPAREQDHEEMFRELTTVQLGNLMRTVARTMNCKVTLTFDAQD